MRTALLEALAGGAAGDVGRGAVDELTRVLGLDPDSSAQALADAAGRPERAQAVRAWGERVVKLLADDPGLAGAVAQAMEQDAPGSGAAWYGRDHTDFRGGVFLREVIGVQVVIQQGGAAVPEAMAGLPPRPGGFTGREDEAAALLAVLDPAGEGAAETPAAVLHAAVSGLGGIGKTALAIEAAHQALSKGWFPGGVLFLDLHGYDQEPVTADRALQALLLTLGIRPEHIPTAPEQRAALYRSALAARAREHGPVLVLADNASSPDQVRPLLPGHACHRVLVTSRDKLSQLGARLVPLDQLTPGEACELLDRALRIADPCDTRAAEDRDAALSLAALCGRLPLALQIVAALLTEDPGMAVTDLVAELTESRDLLDHLDDGERSVRAAFDLSYRRLPPEQARLLRLLALAPGPEASDEVVAALVGAEAPPVRELRALARAHLVERGSGRGWWRLHDLVRAFGVGVVAGDGGLREEGDRARERVLGFYLRWADAADDRLRWLPGREVPERFGERGEALAWFDAERAGLVAAVEWGREERFGREAVRLAECLAEYLLWRRHVDDWIAVAEVAREAAGRAGDRLAEAGAWNNLGLALRRAGRVEEAVQVLTRARDLHQAAGDGSGEADAWNHLGLALGDAGRVEEAVGVLTRARDLHQAARNRAGEASTWNNLGNALREAGRVEEAVQAHSRARDLHQSTGDRPREATAWNNLGNALREAGRAEEAMQAYGASLVICRESEDWYSTGAALYNLAGLHETVGRPAEARAAFLEAADAYTRANAPADARTRATTLTTPPTAPAPPPPEPTDTAAQAAPQSRTADSAPPSPRPPDAPDTAEQ